MDCLIPGEGHELVSAPHTVLSEMNTEPVLVSAGTSWFQRVLLPSLLLLGVLGALPFLLLHGHQTFKSFFFFSLHKWSYVS